MSGFVDLEEHQQDLEAMAVAEGQRLNPCLLHLT